MVHAIVSATGGAANYSSSQPMPWAIYSHGGMPFHLASLLHGTAGTKSEMAENRRILLQPMRHENRNRSGYEPIGKPLMYIWEKFWMPRVDSNHD